MKKFLIATVTFLLPVAALAQTTDFTKLNSLKNEIMSLASTATSFLMILATIYFLWVVISLIRADEKGRAEKKEQLKWAIIGLAAMVCVWGLIRFAASTLGISTNANLGSGAVPCPPGMSYYSGVGCQ